MSSSEPQELFAAVPRWWSEPVLALSAVVAGVAGMSLGTGAVARVFAALSDPGGAAGVTLASPVAYGAMLVLLAVVYAGVAGGVTYAYRAARGFDPAVLRRPDRDAASWTGALVALAVALVAGGTLVETLRATGGPGAVLSVPGSFVAPRPLVRTPMPGLEGAPLLVEGAFAIALIAGVGAPAIAALFHGVLQASLRRVAPAPVALCGTALAVVALASGLDPVGALVVGTLAAAAGYAYDRTDNLAVPMVAYGSLTAATLTTALVAILSAAGAL